jgi:hypothetical protein
MRLPLIAVFSPKEICLGTLLLAEIPQAAVSLSLYCSRSAKQPFRFRQVRPFSRRGRTLPPPANPFAPTQLAARCSMDRT